MVLRYRPHVKDISRRGCGCIPVIFIISFVIVGLYFSRLRRGDRGRKIKGGVLPLPSVGRLGLRTQDIYVFLAASLAANGAVEALVEVVMVGD
jgi:hypothetical protein